MKQTFLLSTLLLFFVTTFGQKATLQIDNIAPRVGDEIEIHFYLGTNISTNNNGDGQIEFNDIVTDSGYVTIGPFSFKVNNQTFLSDSVRISICPKLPKLQNGIWIRKVNFNGDSYLILEQRISGEWETKKTDPKTVTTSFTQDEKKFAEIDLESINERGLSLVQTYSSSHSQTIDENDIFGNGTVNYKLTIYKIIRKSDYSGTFKLREKNFKNLPKNSNFESVIID